MVKNTGEDRGVGANWLHSGRRLHANLRKILDTTLTSF